MKRLSSLLLNLAIGANAMQLVLLLFENRVNIPAWLQVAGRMHPLLLHLPITLVLLVGGFALLQAWRPSSTWTQLPAWLHAAAALAACTALSGFFLSREEGYDAEALAWHKWTGLGLSWLLLAWALLWPKLQGKRLPTAAAGILSVGTVLVAGHQGANITHGADFLLAPVMQNEVAPAVLLEDALLYQDMVRPILASKCMPCHNEDKTKGDLLMTTEAALLKGGKSGALWNLQVPGYGLLMNRIHLPMGDKKHMPPAGKPQLTEDEIFIIEQWLAHGASFKQAVASLPENDTLRQIAATRFGQLENMSFDFAAADAKTVRQLNSANRSVYPLAANSPALGVEFFGRSLFNAAQLQELSAIKDNIVWLNLNKMPVTDADLQVVAGFTQLRRLNVSFTDITGAGLAALKKLPNLQQLSVSGTRLTADDLATLKGLPKLSALYAWNTAVAETARPAIQQKLGKIRVQWGFSGDTIQMKLNAPIIETDKQVITSPIELKLKHFLPGAIIRYTLDGSEPDSLQSAVYKPGIQINEPGWMKARAFKPGWISSDVSSMFFYKTKYKPDSARALLPADNAYKGSGAITINDNVKGDKNFRSGKWLGYKDNPMDVVLYFEQPKQVSSVTMSSLVEIGNYIMPPTRIEVWGGPNDKALKKLATLVPVQPTQDAPGTLEAYELKFAPQQVQCLRVVANTVTVLPGWHRGKGDKGWVFVDELFVN